MWNFVDGVAHPEMIPLAIALEWNLDKPESTLSSSTYHAFVDLSPNT